MSIETPSSPVARQQSVRLVIERLLRDRSVSRAEIARGSGLSKQTISDVMRELEREGWVREDGQIQGNVGRSAVTYAIRPDAAFVLGIDLGISKLHIALADLHGLIVAESIEPTADDGGGAVIAQIARITDDLLSRTGVPRQRLRGGVMGSPGVIDPVSGRIVIEPRIAALDSVDLHFRAELRARLGIEVAIENDVNLAAIGEYWRGNSRKARTFAFIAAGTGIGMGIFADGHLIRGARGAAGEIAYLPLGGDPYDARGLRLGTLETAVSSSSIEDRYVALGGLRWKQCARDLRPA